MTDLDTLPRRTTLVSFFDPPYANGVARERLDLALALAAADWPLALYFAGPGVLMLAQRQGTDEIRDFPAALATLLLFGVEEIYVEAQALERYGLQPDELRIPAKSIDGAELRRIMGRQSCLS